MKLRILIAVVTAAPLAHVAQAQYAVVGVSTHDRTAWGT